MDYYYTTHEIVVAKSPFLFARRSISCWGELETIAHCHRMIYFHSCRAKTIKNRAYLRVFSFYSFIFPFL